MSNSLWFKKSHHHHDHHCHSHLSLPTLHCRASIYHLQMHKLLEVGKYEVWWDWCECKAGAQYVWEISIQIQIMPKLSLTDMKTRGTSIWFDRKLVSPPAPTTTRHHFGRIGEQSVTSRSRALSVFLGGTGMGKFLVVRRISYLYFCPNKPMFDQKNK